MIGKIDALRSSGANMDASRDLPRLHVVLLTMCNTALE